MSGLNGRIGGAVVDGRLGAQQLVDALYRGGAALEDVHHPAHGDDGPGEQDHVGVEGHELAYADAVSDDLVSADQQGEDHGDAQNELQRGPEHAHELHQLEGAGDVLAVEPLEEADLGFLAGKGANQARAGVVFLGLRGDIGEAGLDALEAVVNPAAEVLHQDAGQWHGRQRHQGEPGTDAQQEKQRDHGEEDGIGAVHEGRAEQHAHGIQVVGHAGHDVAGAIALIEARVLLLQFAEEIVAQVELDFARDADENPALGVEEDALDERDGDQQAGEEHDLLLRGSLLDRSMALPRTPGNCTQMALVQTQESVPHRYPQR